MAFLQAGYLAVAIKVQERALAMSHADIQTRISNNLNDQSRGSGKWCYLVAVFGDDRSGDCVYSCDGDLMRAPYSCTAEGATVNMKSAVDVVPMTTYAIEPAESARESAQPLQDVQQLKLNESAATTEVIHLQEARADYEIKLIAPGKGSSAFYPAEVLKRDGPKVFTPGTHVYLNHPTAAEESQRPEGDVANLAGVLTSGAVYHESHAKGPGLYGRMKVFADHATMVEEKAAHVGMSIRASGIAESGKMRDGVPVLKELTGAESVDVVTRAGAGGMILTEGLRPALIPGSAAADKTGGSGATPTEAARTANLNTGGATEMEAAEISKLVEAAVKAALAPVIAQQVPLTERALRVDAREAATKILKDVTLHEAAKGMVIDTVLQSIPQIDGALDMPRFTESVNAEVKRLGAVIAASTGSGRVVGMGSAPVEIKPEEAARRAAADKASDDEAVSIFESLGMPTDAAKFAAKGRAA